MFLISPPSPTKQHFYIFLPLPQKHESFRPIFGVSRYQILWRRLTISLKSNSPTSTKNISGLVMLHRRYSPDGYAALFQFYANTCRHNGPCPPHASTLYCPFRCCITWVPRTTVVFEGIAAGFPAIASLSANR